MTAGMVRIENGFAEVESGLWLMGRGQPAAFFGKVFRHRRKGWRVYDRSSLDLVETTATAKCADSSRPFLTHIPCAATVFAVSGKVLVAPASARRGAQAVKAIPMSAKGSLCATTFGLPSEAQDEPTDQPPNGPADQRTGDSAWVVMATASRTCRIPIDEGQTLSARPEAIVAWTGKCPTGFCPKLSVWDVVLPRGPRDLLFTFYGPGIVWIEGSGFSSFVARHPSLATQRRALYGF